MFTITRVLLMGLALGLAYLFFFVPVEERTVFEHMSRIASSSEADELGEELGTAATNVGEDLRTRLDEARDD